MSEPEKSRLIVMVKKVARRWILSLAQEQHSVTVLYGARDSRKTANYIRSFRDGKAFMRDVKAIPDLGIEEAFDGIRLWSGDREALASLAGWFEKRGYETTGIW